MNGLSLFCLSLKNKKKAYRCKGTESLSGESDNIIEINRKRINEHKSRALYSIHALKK
jgi:hypothetical protein